MSLMRAWLAGLCVLLVSIAGHAREYETDVEIPTLDVLYELGESGDLSDDSVAVLEALLLQPLDINTADRDRLHALPGIDYTLADTIIATRNTHGRFDSIDDLDRVPGMTAQTLARVRPFVRVDRTVSFVGQTRYIATLGSLWRHGYGRQSEEVQTDPQGYFGWRVPDAGRFEGGGLITYRQRATAHYDRAWGHLVSDGFANQADLESLYLATRREDWSLVLGSYTVGFGERLVFDNTGRRTPEGWYVSNGVQLDLQRASVRPRHELFGAAFTLRQSESLEATAFVSHKRHDLYQYDLRYAPDSWLAPVLGDCGTATSNRDGFICGEDGYWYSTRVLDTSYPLDQAYRYLTINDAFAEMLVGAHAATAGPGGSRLGVTGYVSRVEFGPELGEVRFSPGARYPNRPRLYAFGFHFGHRVEASTFAAEYARTQDGGNGFYGRLITHLASWAELTLALRAYDPWYENPHGRGEAARDEALGLAQRNERAARIGLLLRPSRRLRLVSDAELWQNPYRQQGGTWVRVTEPPADLRLAQRIGFEVTKTETISLLGEYINKDLARNGRGESYSDSDAENAGERRKIGISASSNRFPGAARLGADYSVAWQDVSAHADRFDREDLLRLRAAFQVRPQTDCHALLGLWFHQVPNPSTEYYDRQRAAVRAHLEVAQVIGKHTRVQLRYSNIRYRDERPDRYALYHLVRLAAEAEF